jgi:repressor LexA
MRQLTERQRAVLRTIVSSIATQGYPPTLREIGHKLGIKSTNGVNDHLKALEKKGFLSRDDQKSRAMVPTDRGKRAILGHRAKILPFPGYARERRPNDDLVSIPIYGDIAAHAGRDHDDDHHVTDRVQIDRMLIGDRGDVFGLRVDGESMIEDGIFDGDYIFVRKQSTASPGAIVVALIDASGFIEASVKRFYPERDRIRFQPSNSAMEPIYVSRKDYQETQILGIVVGVYRKFD